MVTNTLWLWGVPECNFFCLPPCFHMGTPHMETGTEFFAIHSIMQSQCINKNLAEKPELQLVGQVGPCIPAQKNQPYHNHPLGASLCLANWSYKRKAAMFVATEIRGNIQHLVGRGRNDQLVTGRPISMGPPARTPQTHHNQLSHRIVNWLRFVVCIFLELWPAGGFKASLNCNRVDDFDCSNRLLASNIRQ